MKVTAEAVKAANELEKVGKLNSFELAGLPEGQYKMDGTNVVPFKEDGNNVILFSEVAEVIETSDGEVEILEDVETVEPEASEEETKEGPASAGEVTPEAEFSETADTGGDDDYCGEWNDAALIGPEPEGYMDFLHKDATFLIGEMWGAKDRRNTQDGHWKAVTMPWGRWIEGVPGTKNQPAFGFSRHPEGKNKEGASVVLGSSIEGARKANAMDEMYALGLDIDSGAQIEDVVDKIRSLGLFALIYTSHSHGKSGLEIKRDEVMRKLGISEEPTLPQVQEYLRMHSKSRYEESFITQVRIDNLKKQTKEGVKIALITPPLDKFRIIFPLAEAVKLIDLAPTQAAALEVWEDKITGMSWEALGVHFDTSCTDPSRLFYTARHAKESEWDCMIIRGVPLRFEDVPVYKKHQYTKHRAKLSPFEIAGDDTDTGRAPDAFTPSGKSLNDWHRHAKDRFQIATLLEDMCPDKIRHAGGEAEGHVHTECPFEHEHSKEGGTGTMAVDALDSQSEYWTWFCHHDSCQGRHKLQFLEEALAQGWFEEDVLFDEDGMYLMPPGEEAAKVADADDYFEQAKAFTKETRGVDVEKWMQQFADVDLDPADKNRITEIIAKKTALKKTNVNPMWAKVDRVKKRMAEDKAKREGDKAGVIWTDGDFTDMCDKAQDMVDAANATKPFLFVRGGELCAVEEDEGVAGIKILSSQGAYAYYLNTAARFAKRKGDDGVQGAPAPLEVEKHLYHSPRNHYPGLKGVTSNPFFTKTGELVTEQGYHDESQIYYAPGDFVIPGVSRNPSLEEAQAAIDMLVDELADFPFDGLSRNQIKAQFWDGGVPSLVNFLSALLLPFMREMIDGRTPGHVINKPRPGTGASYLVDVLSIINTGEETPPHKPSEDKVEFAKALVGLLLGGDSIINLDNISAAMDSGELAAAMTSSMYQPRILGKSEARKIAVTCLWLLTANKLQLSDELKRRCILIALNAHMEDPESRTAFKRADIRGYVRENRAEFVHACLTIIQFWVNSGMEQDDTKHLASFENWARTMGGLWKACEVPGFMSNMHMLKTLTDGKRDEMGELIQALVDAAVETDKELTAESYLFKARKAGEGDKHLSLMAVLNAFEEPPRFHAWGWERTSDGDTEYTESRPLGQGFAKAVRDETFNVMIDGAQFGVTFEIGKDRKGTGEYHMRLVPAVADSAVVDGQ